MPAAAAVVTAGSSILVADSAVAPGSSNDYVFFGAGSGADLSGIQPSNLTNFTETLAPIKEFGAAGGFNHSSLQAPGDGTVFKTGIDYARGIVTTADLVAFQTST